LTHIPGRLRYHKTELPRKNAGTCHCERSEAIPFTDDGVRSAEGGVRKAEGGGQNADDGERKGHDKMRNSC